MNGYLEHSLAAVSATLGETGLRILAGLFILLVGWFVASRVGKAVRRAGDRSRHIDATLSPLFAKVARLSVIVITVIIALDKVGVDTTSIIAFLGAMGVAVGLALKDTISDLAAGIVLVILRPISVGEAVDLSGVMGMVESIDLFETRLRSFEGVPIVLPNSQVRRGAIQNFSRATERRIDLTIAIAYESDVERAVALLEGVLRDEPRIKGEPEPLVNVMALADSSVNVLVRGWTVPGDFFATKLDLTKRIKQAFDASGIEIPYPKRDIVVTQGKLAS